MAMRGLGGSQIEELESAVAYCATMKMAEAREPMYAWVKRNAGALDGADPNLSRIQRLKERIIDTSIALRWKDAIPDLLWLVENDKDWRAAGHAAFAMLDLTEVRTVHFGPTEQAFPSNMVEAERDAMMSAFKAWLIRDYQGQGDTAEARKLDEKAQIEFAQRIYEIANERLLDKDAVNKRRGLELVIEIGPADFAKEIGSMGGLRKIWGSLQVFMTGHRADVEVSRMIARMVFGFLEVDDNNVKKAALSMLLGLAEFCDRDEARMVLGAVVQNATDAELVQMANTVGQTIGQRGYSKSQEEMKENLRYKEEEPDTN
jgi:hypothetical protein